MAVRRRSDRDDQWIVDFRFRHPDGRVQRVREVSPVNTRRGAEEYERKLRQALLEGRRSGEVIPTLAEFAPRWIEGHAQANRQKHSTVVSKESILKHHLLPHLGKKRLDELTAEDVQRTKGRLRGKSPKTVNNVLSVLGKLLKTAVQWGVLARLPVDVELVKAPQPTMEFYHDAEFERLVEAAGKLDGRILVFVLLAGDAGLRAGEVMALEWSDVDLRSGHITVQRTEWRGQVGAPKGGRSRTIPLTGRLAAALQAARHLRGPRVLYREAPRKDRRAEVTQKTLQKWMETATKRAGLQASGKLHILRHTFCSRLAMAGAPAKAIQELAGHQNLSTTQRYMHLSPAAKQGAIRLLETGGSGWAPEGHQPDPLELQKRDH